MFLKDKYMKTEVWERNGYASAEKYFAYQKQYYQDNREKILLSKRNDKSGQLLRHAKQRASDRKIEFTITRDYVKGLLVSHCPILGIELCYTNSILCDDSPTLDRIDNSKGYVADNVQILSCIANRMKSNATPDMLRKFADYIMKTYPADFAG